MRHRSARSRFAGRGRYCDRAVLLGTSIDTTDSKRAQLELQRAKERLDLLIQNAKLSPFEKPKNLL